MYVQFGTQFYSCFYVPVRMMDEFLSFVIILSCTICFCHHESVSVCVLAPLRFLLDTLCAVYVTSTLLRRVHLLLNCLNAPELYVLVIYTGECTHVHSH